MFDFGPSAATLGILAAALLLDALFGDLRRLFRRGGHPVALLGSLIFGLDRKLNRDDRSRADRMVRGALVTLAVIVFAAAIGFGLHRLARAVPYGWALELVAVFLLVAQRGLFDHVLAVARGLDRGLAQGREAVSHIVGRDPASLDAHGVARAAIESCAENFADGVVAPAFWYALLGLPGLFAYKAINTLDSMIGHRSDRHEAFGKLAARIDDFANLVPARLSGLLVALAATCVPGGNPFRAVVTMVRDAGKHRSPNAGWPEAAAAGGLGLALAGPRRYGSIVIDDPWIGSGRARATPGDIRRMLFLFGAACALHLLLVLGVAYALAA